MVKSIDSRTLQNQELFMKISDYTGHVGTAARVVTGIGLVKAGYDIATGQRRSVVGSIVLPQGTKSEVTWQRAVIGGVIATAGLFAVVGKVPCGYGK
jgi:hypothetical protein